MVVGVPEVVTMQHIVEKISQVLTAVFFSPSQPATPHLLLAHDSDQPTQLAIHFCPNSLPSPKSMVLKQTKSLSVCPTQPSLLSGTVAQSLYLPSCILQGSNRAHSDLSPYLISSNFSLNL